MAVTFNKKNNAYIANINGKQFSYSISKYGPLAKLLAEKSLKEKKIIIYSINIKFNDYSLWKYIQANGSGKLFIKKLIKMKI